MQNNTLEYDHWFCFQIQIKIELKYLKLKIFFLKVWAQNVGVHYTQEHIIHSKMQDFLSNNLKQ